MNAPEHSPADPPEVVCLGEAMAMVTPRHSEPLETAGSFAIYAGGAEANVAVYLASLGHRARWVSRVGDDPLGRRVLRAIATVGVDTSLVEVDPRAPTGVYFKDPGVDKTTVFYYRRGSAASLMDANLVPRILQGPPPLLHLSGITPALSERCDEMMHELIPAARDRGVTVSFDVNYRPGLWDVSVAGKKLLALARGADIVFVGMDEGRALWGVETPELLAELIHGPSALVVKDGADGATAFFDGGPQFVPALETPVSEPVGAGDAFAAGWLSGWLRRLPHVQRLRLGHMIAGVALSSTADHQPVPASPLLEAALSWTEVEWASKSR